MLGESSVRSNLLIERGVAQKLIQGHMGIVTNVGVQTLSFGLAQTFDGQLVGGIRPVTGWVAGGVSTV